MFFSSFFLCAKITAGYRRAETLIMCANLVANPSEVKPEETNILRRYCQHSILRNRCLQQIELLEVEVLVWTYRNLFIEALFKRGDQVTFLAVKSVRNLGIDPQGNAIARHLAGLMYHFAVNVVTEGLARYQKAVTLAIKTGLAHQVAQWFPNALAGHLYQTHFRHG